VDASGASAQEHNAGGGQDSGEVRRLQPASADNAFAFLCDQRAIGPTLLLPDDHQLRSQILVSII